MNPKGTTKAKDNMLLHAQNNEIQKHKEFNLDHPLVLFILNSSPAPEFILQGISKKSIAAIKEHSLSKLEMF